MTCFYQLIVCLTRLSPAVAIGTDACLTPFLFWNCSSSGRRWLCDYRIFLNLILSRYLLDYLDRLWVSLSILLRDVLFFIFKSDRWLLEIVLNLFLNFLLVLTCLLWLLINEINDLGSLQHLIFRSSAHWIALDRLCLLFQYHSRAIIDISITDIWLFFILVRLGFLIAVKICFIGIIHWNGLIFDNIILGWMPVSFHRVVLWVWITVVNEIELLLEVSFADEKQNYGDHDDYNNDKNDYDCDDGAITVVRLSDYSNFLL